MVHIIAAAVVAGVVAPLDQIGEVAADQHLAIFGPAGLRFRDQGRQVKPALIRVDTGDVTQPNNVGCEAVKRHRKLMRRCRGYAIGQHSRPNYIEYVGLHWYRSAPTPKSAHQVVRLLLALLKA